MNEAYAFEIPKKKSDLQPFLDILENPKILKMAHNMKYEHTWARTIWGIEIQGWTWDSMLAALVDNVEAIGLHSKILQCCTSDYSRDFRYICPDVKTVIHLILCKILTSPAGRKLRNIVHQTLFINRLSMLQKCCRKEIKLINHFTTFWR